MAVLGGLFSILYASIEGMVSGKRTITHILQSSLLGRLDRVSPVIYGTNIHFVLCFTVCSPVSPVETNNKFAFCIVGVDDGWAACASDCPVSMLRSPPAAWSLTAKLK